MAGGEYRFWRLQAKLGNFRLQLCDCETRDGTRRNYHEEDEQTPVRRRNLVLDGKNREKYREIWISGWKVMPCAWPEPIFLDLLSVH